LGREAECQKHLDAIVELPDDDELRASCGILTAERAVLHSGEDCDALFAPLEALCLKKGLQEQLREVYHAWGRMAELGGDHRRAAELLRKGMGITERIAKCLPEEYHDRYLQQFERRRLARDLERIAAGGGP
jgi:hypothetical protein